MSTLELERELISGLDGELSSELHCDLDDLDDSEDVSDSNFSSNGFHQEQVQYQCMWSSMW